MAIALTLSITDKELNAIIKKFGSLDAYKKFIKEQLQEWVRILEEQSDESDANEDTTL